MLESLSFSLWTVTSVFAFLEDSGYIPEEDIFLQLIFQPYGVPQFAGYDLISVCFLSEADVMETLVAHLPSVTHASVKHTFLTSPSSSPLFAEAVIRDSLTQVKEDSRLELLLNLFSSRGGMQTASTASVSGQWRGFSSTSSLSSSSSSSSYAKSSSRSSCGSKCPAPSS